MPPHVHAIGDKGNRIILDVYEKLLTKHDLTNRDHRWRVIHAQVVHPDDFARFGQLKLVAEINPYHVSDDMRWMEERIGRRAFARRVRVPEAEGRRRRADLRQRQPRNECGAVLPESGLRTLRGGVAADPRRGSRRPAGSRISGSRSRRRSRPTRRDPRGHLSRRASKGTLSPGMLADIAVFDTDLVAAGKIRSFQTTESKGAIHGRRWADRLRPVTVLAGLAGARFVQLCSILSHPEPRLPHLRLPAARMAESHK